MRQTKVNESGRCSVYLCSMQHTYSMTVPTVIQLLLDYSFQTFQSGWFVRLRCVAPQSGHFNVCQHIILSHIVGLQILVINGGKLDSFFTHIRNNFEIKVTVLDILNNFFEVFGLLSNDTWTILCVSTEKMVTDLWKFYLQQTGWNCRIDTVCYVHLQYHIVGFLQ